MLAVFLTDILNNGYKRKVKLKRYETHLLISDFRTKKETQVMTPLHKHEKQCTETCLALASGWASSWASRLPL